VGHTGTALTTEEFNPSANLTYLEPTWFIDSGHPDVCAYAERVCTDADDDKEKAVRLFYAIRDDIRYNPYSMNKAPEHLRASNVLAAGEGYCVPKAVLMAACARAVGIPSRLGFADVTNHLTTEKLSSLMDDKRFLYHGYAELWLEGRWLKVTPTFNRSLCERFGVKTMEFDGKSDALLQGFDRKGNKHMEYLHDHGSYDDVPYDELMRVWEASCPRILHGVEGHKLADNKWGNNT